MAKGKFIEYVVSDNPNKYPNDGEQGSYYYELYRGPKTLISFTINGTSYQAEEGMTWAEWIDSEYSSSAQTRQCKSCGTTENLGEYRFALAAPSYGIGWRSSLGCETCIYTTEYGASEPVVGSLKITANADYTIRAVCND